MKRFLFALFLLPLAAFGQGTFFNCQVSNQLFLPNSGIISSSGYTAPIQNITSTSGNIALSSAGAVLLTATGGFSVQVAGVALFPTVTNSMSCGTSGSYWTSVYTAAIGGANGSSMIDAINGIYGNVDVSNDLGQPFNRWRNIYVGGVIALGNYTGAAAPYMALNGTGSNGGWGFVTTGTGVNTLSKSMADGIYCNLPGFSTNESIGNSTHGWAKVYAAHYIGGDSGFNYPNPTVSALSGSGSGATASVTGTDTAGYITVNTGTVSGVGDIVQLNFGGAYDAAPKIIIWPANQSAAVLSQMPPVNQSSTTTAHFQINGTSTLTLSSSTSYQWWYHVIQ